MIHIVHMIQRRFDSEAAHAVALPMAAISATLVLTGALLLSLH